MYLLYPSRSPPQRLQSLPSTAKERSPSLRGRAHSRVPGIPGQVLYDYNYRVAGLSCPEAGGRKSAILWGFPDVFSLFGPCKVGAISFRYSWTTGMKKKFRYLIPNQLEKLEAAKSA